MTAKATATATAAATTTTVVPSVRMTELQEELEFPAALKGKRILLATESLGPVNGVSRTTLSLIQYLRRNGVQVAVVAPQAPGRKTRLDDANELEIRLTGYPLPYNPELAVVYPFRIDRLCERTFQPDLIYLASPASLGFQILLQLRQLQFQPVVLCNFQTDLSAYCEILFPTPLDAWAVWVLRSTQGYLFSHPAVRTVFYPSFGVRKYLEKAGVQPSKLVNLRRGVNTELFNPSALDMDFRKQLAPNGEVILVSVSRIAPEKGFEFLSEVAHTLVVKSFPFHLLIVGGNRNPAVEVAVQDLFADISSHITFTGMLEGTTLARAYASSDIFLHSSITETFGLVVLEAMASGLPVIARDEGGPSEIVEHNRSGFLVPPSDVSTFVARIEELTSNTILRSTMGKTAREISLQATWEKINNRVAHQLADALTHQAPPTSLATSTAPARPISSLLLRRPVLSSGISGAIISFLIDAQITAGVGIIFGVWCGLVLTWLLVKTGNLVKAQMPWLLSGIRRWRNGRLRERERERLLGEGGHGSRRI
jgi:glycosyltransferase involved in cell wall biosynthesis